MSTFYISHHRVYKYEDDINMNVEISMTVSQGGDGCVRTATVQGGPVDHVCSSAT